MGFAPDLRRILKLLPKDRQTLMFSATMPAELNRVASEALSSPKRLELAPPTKPTENVTQAIYPVPRHLKVAMLDHILRGGSTDCTIVFTRTKHGADRLGRQLKALGHDVAVIHGNRSQGQRERALRDFQRGRAEVLVATDIASRGIDVDDVSHVVNFDVPHTPEDYVHRVGRTGRMHATGDAFTLMSPEERKDVAAIERFIGKTLTQVKVPGFDYQRRAEPKAKSHGEHDRGRRGSHRSQSHGSGNTASDRTTPSHPQRPAGPTHGRKPRPGSSDRRSRRRM
jgi:ATP-dependent RNA helicase RhlE